MTGKGGTGKTTVAALLGLLAARSGKKTIIVQIETAAGVAPLFGWGGGADYAIRNIDENLDLINVQGKQAFEEYVLLQIKFKSIYRAVFGNRLVSSFIDAVPGLAELMCIGKIYVLTKDYDLTIVDAPATGHGISLLQIPSVVSSAVRVGPLRVHSEAIGAMLKNPAHTEVVITTLPEEMPVAETLELNEMLRGPLGIAVGGIVVNQVLAPVSISRKLSGRRNGAPAWQPLLDLARVHQSRVQLQQEYIRLLRSSIGAGRLWSVPFSFFERMTVAELDRLTGRITELP